jgi:hypothetical protein
MERTGPAWLLRRRYEPSQLGARRRRVDAGHQTSRSPRPHRLSAGWPDLPILVWEPVREGPAGPVLIRSTHRLVLPGATRGGRIPNQALDR